MQREGESRYSKADYGERTEAACREPDTGLSSCERNGNSSGSDRPPAMDTGETTTSDVPRLTE